MTTYSAITNSEIAVGAPVTNNLKTKERDNLLAIQENDASAPTIAFSTSAGTIASQGDLATLNSVAAAQIDANAVGQSEIANNAVGQGELITATVEVSGADSGGGTFFQYAETTTDYTLGAAVKVGGVTGNNTSHEIETVITAALGSKSTTYKGGTRFRGTFVQVNTVTNYIRVRYVTGSPPYIGEDGLMYLFAYCKLNKLGEVIGVHVCDDPPWRQPEYKKIKGIKTINSVSHDNAGIPEITGREMVMGDKFTHMNETPHPFGVLEAGETVVMLDPISDVMKRLHEIHTSGESVGELIHDGTVAIGNKITRYSPNSIKVVSIKWK